MTPSPLIDQFRADHRRIEEHLRACDPLLNQATALVARLKDVRALFLGHFDAKDAFYLQLKQICETAGDTAGARISQIFADSMHVQSGAIRRFFTALDGMPATAVPQSYQTVAHTVRSRLATEEQAVFPLFLRNLTPGAK